jgi:hypothetical protein
MMVPVFYDRQRRQTKVWAFLRLVDPRPGHLVGHAIYHHRSLMPPATLSIRNRTICTSPAIGTSLATPVVAEVYVTGLLDRDEFRRHCDAYVTRARPSWPTSSSEFSCKARSTAIDKKPDVMLPALPSHRSEQVGRPLQPTKVRKAGFQRELRHNHGDLTHLMLGAATSVLVFYKAFSHQSGARIPLGAKRRRGTGPLVPRWRCGLIFLQVHSPNALSGETYGLTLVLTQTCFCKTACRPVDSHRLHEN